MTLTPEPSLEDLVADLQRRVAALEAAAKIPAPAGASGVITLPDISSVGPYLKSPSVTPTGEYANVRSGPSTSTSILGQMLAGQEVTVVDVTLDAEGKVDRTGHPFEWYALSSGGYVRADVVRSLGTWDALKPPSSIALYPSPVSYTVLTNDFRDSGENQHLGWDLAGSVGSPIVAGPNGGFLVKWAFCRLCGSEGKSSYPLNVFSNPAWNYGYGHYVIVRYDNETLPSFTRMYLDARGWVGYHAFVMYAHLSKIPDQVVGPVTPFQTIGLRGSSGNSSGPHLHLELRFSKEQTPYWENIRGGLADPGALFSR